MTSVWKRLGLALTLIAAASVGTSAATQLSKPDPLAPLAARPQPAQVRQAQPAPPYIKDRINELGRSFNGRVGIAVRSIDDGWSTGWKADEIGRASCRERV